MMGDAILAVGLVGAGALVVSRGAGAAAPASVQYAPPASWVPFTEPLLPEENRGASWSPWSSEPLQVDSAPLYAETIGSDPAIEYPISHWAPSMPAVETPASSQPAEVAAVNTARNLDAFLAIIRAGESSDNYLALVGGGEFTSFADHPAITGEFAGIRRADDGRLTTAAGAYQITRTTWRDLGGAKKYGDFSPSAQDRAAVDLIKRRGAYQDVIAGRVTAAVRKLQNEWEMFTLARWRGERVLAAFTNQGGALA